MAGRKIFVGSLPTGIDELTLRAEFVKYGQVEDVFIKQNCEAGRQWAFVTFQTAEQANFAKDSCDRNLMFPGAESPCDVMLAKNQGLFGQEPLGSAGTAPGGEAGPRKIFVGSLPDGCQEGLLRAEFAQYGNIEEVYLKPGCEPGRQWSFVTFSYPAQAQAAAAGANGIVHFPGASKVCEVTLARNQGMYGQDAMGGPSAQHGAPQHGSPGMSSSGASGARKIFVGSLPDMISENALRDELSRYGQITDVYLKTGCEPGRQWAFVTFAHPQQASAARDSCDRKLFFPGTSSPCEVTMAKNQGLFGQDSIAPNGPVSAPPPHSQGYSQGYQGQPPPPATPPPAHLTPWRMYKTVSGIPYYHNQTTGQTVWECPPDLQAQGGQQGHRYAPY